MVYYNGFEATIYFVAESTEGTTPTSAAFLNLAQKVEVTVTEDPNPVEVPLSGSRDFAGYGQGIDNPIINFKINPSLGSGKDFLTTYLDSNTSFTLLLMIDASPDVIFARVPGCKIKSASGRVAIYPERAPLEVDLELWGWKFLYTQTGGTPTFESAPSTFINWSNVTVKREGSTITDWWEFNWTIDYSLFRNRDNSGVTTGITRGRRVCNGNWIRSVTDSRLGNAELDEAKNATAIDLICQLVSSNLNFTDSVYKRVSITHSIDEQVGINHEFQAATFSIS